MKNDEDNDFNDFNDDQYDISNEDNQYWYEDENEEPILSKTMKRIVVFSFVMICIFITYYLMNT